MMQKIIIVCCLFLSVSTLCLAAKPDSTTFALQKGWVKSISESQLEQEDSLRYKPVDLSLKGFQHFNPIYKHSPFVSYLGNLGSAYRNLVFTPPSHIGFDMGIHQFDAYNIFPQDIRYYNARKRFSDLTYTLGAGSEQLLSLLHTQNINPRLNLGFQLRRLVTDGYINHQITYTSSFNVFGSYQGKDGRYHLIANAFYNNLYQDENGGLKEDAAIEKSKELPLTLNVNLVTAQARWRSRGISLRQFYDLKRDSTALANHKPLWRLSHGFSMEQKGYVYYDQNPNYNSFYTQTLDTLKTYDTTGVNQLKNQVSISTISKWYSITGGVNHSLILLKQNQLDTTLQNIVGTLSAKVFSKMIALSTYAEYGFSGTNKGDYIADAKLTYTLPNESQWVLGVASYLQTPTWIIRSYHSSHFNWDNQFNKTATNSASVAWQWTEHKLNVYCNYFDIKNYIYFSSLANPFQYNSAFGLLQAGVDKDFKLYSFVLSSKAVWQRIDGADLLHLPEWMTCQSLYFDNFLFKKALHLQLGIDFKYESAYYSLLYMPVTGQFYSQHEKILGNYPTFDVFANLQIKTARIFIKMENLTNGFSPIYPNYLFPHYPQQARVFKIGINWRFLD